MENRGLIWTPPSEVRSLIEQRASRRERGSAGLRFDTQLVRRAANYYRTSPVQEIGFEPRGDGQAEVWVRYGGCSRGVNFMDPSYYPGDYFNYSRYNAGVRPFHDFADKADYTITLGAQLASQLKVPFVYQDTGFRLPIAGIVSTKWGARRS